jgi:hypothetical protein
MVQLLKDSLAVASKKCHVQHQTTGKEKARK